MTGLRSLLRARRSADRIRVTPRGWTLVGAAVAMGVAGWVLGAVECSAVGVAGLLLVVAAVVWVRYGRAPLRVLRRPDPLAPHVGDHARIDVALTPTTRRGAAGFVLVEDVDGGRLQARFAIPRLRAGTAVRRAYRLPTERRGPAPVGPATAWRADPLGLARGRTVLAEAQSVIVRPRVFRIAPPDLGAGTRPAADQTDHARARTPDATGDFAAVRPYEVGDDPRRVHWAASARADELMVRQDVAPRPGRTLVVLDTRAFPAGHDGAEAFERAVEAAASVVTALQRIARPVECRTANGTTLTRSGTDRSHRVLDRLAVVAPGDADLIAAQADDRGHHAPETVVLVTAAHDAVTRAAVAHFARRSATLCVVTGDTDPMLPDLSVRDRTIVVDARAIPFPDAWERAVGRRGPVHRGAGRRSAPGSAPRRGSLR